jgi:type IV fimbrial biogenesis protein FimT
MPNKASKKGFSLLELLIVITLAALVTAVGVPSFQNTVANQRRTTAVNELALTFNLARSEAIKRVRYVSICKSADGETCGGDAVEWEDGWIIFSNADNATPGSVDEGDEIIRAHPALNDSLTLRRRGVIDGFVSFRPSGTMGTNVGNLTGTLMLCDKRGADMARGLILRPSGQWEVTHDIGHDNEAITCPGGE